MTIALFRLPTGIVTIRLFPEVAPRAVEMIVQLVEAGYYTGLVWYEIGERWIATGCPVGMGEGTVAWMLHPETHPDVRHRRGALSLAPFGDALVSCRIHLLTDDVPEWDGKRTIAGWVIDGMAAVDRMARRRWENGPPRTLLARMVRHDELAEAVARGTPLRAGTEGRT